MRKRTIGTETPHVLVRIGKRPRYIYAISEDVEDIFRYIDQFPNLFKDLDEFEILSMKKVPRRELINSGDSMLEWFNDDIVLTREEINYYRKKIRPMYENVKTMISTAILFNRQAKLSLDEKLLVKTFSDTLYGKIKSFQEYLNVLDKSILLGDYIMNPDTFQTIKELDEQYERLVMDISPKGGTLDV